MPDSFRQLQNKPLKRPGGDREMADILALVLLHDEVLVEQAVVEALRVEQTSKQHALNCLGRLDEPQKPKPSAISPALKLVIEPVADTDRYDRLRGFGR